MNKPFLSHKSSSFYFNSNHQLCCSDRYTKRITVSYMVTCCSGLENLLAGMKFPCCLLISKLWNGRKYQWGGVTATEQAWLVLVRDVPCAPLSVKLAVCTVRWVMIEYSRKVASHYILFYFKWIQLIFSSPIYTDYFQWVKKVNHAH